MSLFSFAKSPSADAAVSPAPTTGSEQVQVDDNGKPINPSSQENNLAITNPIWDTPVDPNATTQQPIVIQQPAAAPAQPTPAEAMQTHIDGLNMLDGLDLNAVANDLVAGNTDTLAAAFETMAGSVYQTGMQQAQQMMSSMLTDFKREFTEENQVATQQTAELESMLSALPFARDPNVLPIAKQVFNAFRETQNFSVQDSIVSTEKFFQSMGDATKSQNHASRDVDFSRSRVSKTEPVLPTGEQDWVTILGGASRT